MARLDLHLWQAVTGRRTRRIQVIEITQGGFGATGRIRVVLVSASAHVPCLSKQLHAA
ncbi:hypothetical protein [Rhodanobacter umsongensis]